MIIWMQNPLADSSGIDQAKVGLHEREAASMGPDVCVEYRMSSK